MRRTLLALALTVLLVPTPGHSELFGRLPQTPGGTDYQAYYDDVTDTTYLAILTDPATFNLEWAEAIGFCGNLEINGVDGWRLPSADLNGDGEVKVCGPNDQPDISNCADNEMQAMLRANDIWGGYPQEESGPFVGVQANDRYWYGTGCVQDERYAWTFVPSSFPPSEGATELVSCNAGGFREGSRNDVWCVHSGDVALVAEICDNGVDDDGDGDIDADDTDCAPEEPSEVLVRCFHTPVYVPNAGEIVTIEAEAIDAEGAALDVEFLEIFLDSDRNSPQVQTVNGSRASLEYQADGSFAYACRASTAGGDKEFFSGFKRVGVEESDEDFPAVPIRMSGKLDERIDIVFFFDEDEYESFEDSRFIEDVGLLLQQGFFTIPEFVRQQKIFNFWIAKTSANSGPDPDDSDPSNGISCLREAPEDYRLDFSFSDSAAIVHRSACRDNAGNGTFTMEMDLDRLQVVAHEAGHSPFGLADEYCCDGGYFTRSSTTFPNMFDTEENCQLAAVDGGFDPAACEVVDSNPDAEEDWWLYEPRKRQLSPDEGDLMQSTGCATFASGTDCKDSLNVQFGSDPDPNGLYACLEAVEDFYFADQNGDGQAQGGEVWICRTPGDALNAVWEDNGADRGVDRYRIGDSERQRLDWFFAQCLGGNC